MESVKVTTFSEYQKAAMRTCTASSKNVYYMITGLISECGEVTGKIAKVIRDDSSTLTDEKKHGILCELGDVMWMIAGYCEVKGIDMDELTSSPVISYKSGQAIFEHKAIAVMAQMLTRSASEILFGEGVVEDDETMEYNANKLCSIIGMVDIMAGTLGFSLREVCQVNIDKLADRFNRNQIQGSGDNR